MEGFSDLLFLLIMFLVISRSFGAARRKKEEQEQASQGSIAQAEPPREQVQASREPGLRSHEQMRTRDQMRPPRDRVPQRSEPARPSLDPAGASPGGQTRAAKRSDPVSEFRRRLVDAAREWEAEQRRRAGIPDEEGDRARPERQMPSTPPPARQPAHRERPAAREAKQAKPDSPWRTEEKQPPAGLPSRWKETRDVTPDRTAAALAGRGGPRAETPPLEVRPRAARHSTGLTGGASAADESRELAPHEHKTASPLARLERFPPLKRAVILAEILGRPRPR
jgi:hypothetical protein